MFTSAIGLGTVQNDTTIGTNNVLGFYYDTGKYFILYASGISRVFLSYDNYQFLNTTTVQTAFGTNNNSHLLPGSIFYVFYQASTPYIYKAGCLGQAYFTSGNCVSYVCMDINCATCPFIPSICTSCINGYSLNSTTLNCTSNAIANNSSNTSSNSTSSNSNSTTYKFPFL